MKKTKINKLIKLYYLVLILFLVHQTISTIFKLSQTIAYQDRIGALQARKQELVREQERLEVELGETTSLSSLREKAIEEYIPISNIIIISADQPLALKLQ
jgi:hypothetical protein